MTSIHELLDEYERTAPDKRTKGLYFERLVREFIATDPMYQAQFEDVWLWQDWPGRDGRVDTGIDLVAKERYSGGFCAIQCKFFAPTTTITKDEIDSFFTESGKHPFTSRIIVTTTDKWTKHAQDSLENQQIPTFRIGLNEFEQSGLDWSKYRFGDTSSSLAAAEPKKLRPHQSEALEAVLGGFDEQDRGKLVMACGTGKTFTSLRIAEHAVPRGGSVLFLVPSIALLSQTLREWTADANDPLRAFAVCSDTKVGKDSEDLRLTDLSFPATTNAAALVESASAGSNPLGLTVYFSTYQSIDVIHQAQGLGLPEFDLVVCDEAHRTAGVLDVEKQSPFVRVHDAGYIAASRRLYMTATPKIYGEAAKSKAKDAAVELASMDREDLFGREFHRLGFGEAVERDLLTDYKVLVLAVSTDAVSAEFQQQFKTDDYELNLDDAARIAGIYKAFGKSGVEGLSPDDRAPMRRAVAFSRSIKDSQHIASLLNENRAIADGLLADENPLVLEAEHVDGTMNVMVRNSRIDWLKAPAEGNTTRILTNARCLSEGVDVPSLDAVIFLNSRDSQVDVVQSVGRVMRKLEGKQYGYIILPIAIPAGVEPEQALNDNAKYKVVWEVLRALRAHDERFEARIERLGLNRAAHDEQVQVIGIQGFAPGGERDGAGADAGAASSTAEPQQVPLDFTPLGGAWREAVYAKIVQRVGEREYWENWASNVADVATSQTERIRRLVEVSPDAGAAFARFVKGLRDNLNPGITESDAMEMLAQHLITQPVLEALFEGFSFSGNNAVAGVMQEMLDALEGEHLESETSELQPFYDSVRTRVRGITDDRGKQEFLKLLYQRFFAVAMRKASERLGIVYTPTEVVDFILRSADELLRSEFGTSLGERGVHILDPFTGTGTFLVRLLQLGLISDAQLPHKYREELHANEINLLAYYVAAVNIEEAYHQRMGGNYVPFPGLLLTDTFQMFEDGDELDGEGVFAQNNAGVVAQKQLPITVIVGNPPYAVGQASGNDDNKNMSYPTLDRRIRETYAARSSAKNKNNLYDAYIRAIRWASDRVGDRGIVAFVSNGGYIDSNTADGLRKSLVEEFSSLYVYNLRGNQRTSGEESRREGGKIFDAGSRATIAIALLVKNADAERGRLHYAEIGDYLTRSAKLERLRREAAAKSVPWQDLLPDADGDWINLRSDDFSGFDALQELVTVRSAGIKSNRDAWVYNFSRTRVEADVSAMIEFFNSEVDRRNDDPSRRRDNDATRFSWNRADDTRLRLGRKLDFNEARVTSSVHRPYAREVLYFDERTVDMAYRIPALFPSGRENEGFVLASPSSHYPEFAALMVRGIPDLHTIDTGQFFSRYRWERGLDDPNQLGTFDGDEEWTRIDNVTDATLTDYRATYSDLDVTKDDIFDYVYGILHSPEYRTRFAADLKKMLPRIPKVADFAAFRDAGRELGRIHRDYETIEPYALDVTGDQTDLTVTKMRYAGTRPNVDKTTVVYNEKITIRGIPIEAHDYKLGSRSAIDWVLERYQVTTDKASGIVNDPNDWGREHDDPRYILDLIGRVTTVSVETVRIVNALPALDILS
jgi:predicted helicase